jgi:hypothetical protein
VPSEEHSTPDEASGTDERYAGLVTRSLSAPETVATVIGRYRLGQKIGEGGMGEIWQRNRKPLFRAP